MNPLLSPPFFWSALVNLVPAAVAWTTVGSLERPRVMGRADSFATILASTMPPPASIWRSNPPTGNRKVAAPRAPGTRWR